MFIGFIDDFLSLRKQLNTGLRSNQKIILQSFISLIFIIICASNNLIPDNIQIANKIVNIGNIKNDNIVMEIGPGYGSLTKKF